MADKNRATGNSQFIGLASFFDNPSFSDLTIKVQGRSFHCHRVVVCSQSKPLTAHISAGFLGATTGVIDLEDDDEYVVECFLKYLYAGDYPVSFPRSNSKDIFKTNSIL